MLIGWIPPLIAVWGVVWIVRMGHKDKMARLKHHEAFREGIVLGVQQVMKDWEQTVKKMAEEALQQLCIEYPLAITVLARDNGSDASFGEGKAVLTEEVVQLHEASITISVRLRISIGKRYAELRAAWMQVQ